MELKNKINLSPMQRDLSKKPWIRTGTKYMAPRIGIEDNHSKHHNLDDFQETIKDRMNGPERIIKELPEGVVRRQMNPAMADAFKTLQGLNGDFAHFMADNSKARREGAQRLGKAA